MNSDYAKGVALIAAGTIAWGIGYPLWKLLAIEIPPILLTAMTFLLAAAIMIVLYRPNAKELFQRFRKNALVLVTLGLSGGVLGTGLLCFALTRIDSGVAAFLEKLQPVFALLACRVVLGETIPRRVYPYMFLALVSSYGIANPDPFSLEIKAEQLYGLLAAVGSSFFYGINTVLSKYAVDGGVSPKELSLFRMLLGGLLAIPILLVIPGNGIELVEFNPRLVCLLLAATIISLVLAFHLFFTGLQSVPAGVATFLELVTPVIALYLGWLVLNESVTFTQLLSIPPLLFCIFQISNGAKPSEVAAISH